MIAEKNQKMQKSAKISGGGGGWGQDSEGALGQQRGYLGMEMHCKRSHASFWVRKRRKAGDEG